MKQKIFIVLFLLLLTITAFAFPGKLTLHGKTNLASGDIRIFIYDANTGGNSVYDSESDHNSTIRPGGNFDVTLGEQRILDLNQGTNYCFALRVNSQDLNYGSHDRKCFESPTGNDINLSTGGLSTNGQTRLDITEDGNVNIKINFCLPSGQCKTAWPFVPSTLEWDNNFSKRGAFDSNDTLDSRFSKITDVNNGFVRSIIYNASWPVNDANVIDTITAINYSRSLIFNAAFSTDFNNTNVTRLLQDASCDNNSVCNITGKVVNSSDLNTNVALKNPTTNQVIAGPFDLNLGTTGRVAIRGDSNTIIGGVTQGLQYCITIVDQNITFGFC